MNSTTLDCPVLCFQAAANRALCDLSKASPAAAKTVLNAGIMNSIKQQLDGTDDSVKEAGLDAVAVIAAKSAEMAEAAMDGELLDKVVAIIAAPSTPIPLLESACTALDNVAAQTAPLAQKVLKAQVVPPLLAVLRNKRMRAPSLQTAALRCICQIAHHESAAAAAVAEAGAVPVAMQFAADDSNAAVRHAAAALLQQVAVRTARLSKEVASEGCIVALIESLKLDRGTPFATAPVMALAHIAAFGSAFAQAVSSLSCDLLRSACTARLLVKYVQNIDRKL
jgi:hypothetical protein